MDLPIQLPGPENIILWCVVLFLLWLSVWRGHESIANILKSITDVFKVRADNKRADLKARLEADKGAVEINLIEDKQIEKWFRQAMRAQEQRIDKLEEALNIERQRHAQCLQDRAADSVRIDHMEEQIKDLQDKIFRYQKRRFKDLGSDSDVIIETTPDDTVKDPPKQG